MRVDCIGKRAIVYRSRGRGAVVAFLFDPLATHEPNTFFLSLARFVPSVHIEPAPCTCVHKHKTSSVPTRSVRSDYVRVIGDAPPVAKFVLQTAFLRAFGECKESSRERTSATIETVHSDFVTCQTYALKPNNLNTKYPSVFFYFLFSWKIPGKPDFSSKTKRAKELVLGTNFSRVECS